MVDSYTGSPKMLFSPIIGQFIVVLLAALILPVCRADTAQFSPINMHQTSWTAKDGAPPSIIGISQTRDGWMWLASVNGMYRFDGVHFERLVPKSGSKPRSDIWGMRVLANGDLWMGYRFGGASVLRGERLQTYGAADGFTTSSVLDFAEDESGRVWASTAHGFRIFDGHQWTAADERVSGKTGACFFQTDANKKIWARCENGIYALAKGANEFTPEVLNVNFGRLAMATDGTVWATGGGTNELIALSGPGMNKPRPNWQRPRGSGGAMLFEQDGQHVWSALSNGVVRSGPDESGLVFGVANGLSGSLPNCFYQDTEGNIWVGTENGLDRFRPTALTGVAFPPIFWDSEAIAAGDKGVLWVGGTEVKSPTRQTLASLPLQNSATAVSVTYRDGADVWTGGREGLWHLHGATRERLPLPSYISSMQFYAIVKDIDGGLWISARRDGTARFKNGNWQRGGGHSELMSRADSIFRDSRGRLWFGYPNNSIRILDGAKVSDLGAAQGLRVGSVQQIIESGRDIWVGGINGLFHFDGSRFRQVVGKANDEFQGISGIIDFGDALWLNGSAGITVVEKNELARAISDSNHRVNFRRFDYQDGLRGVATNSFPIPSAVLGSDRKLWFATTAGLFWLDTKTQVTNKVPPQVYVRNINADGVDVLWSTSSTALIPANPGRIQIDYTALSYTMPERMRFQYRIDGVDHDWQDGGIVRTATYTGLAPKAYRFRLRAANNDGVWSKTEATANFEVMPAYYQTHWFRMGCFALLALTLWVIYKMRVAYVARQAVARFATRMDERERIARDLHDTILQSIHALLWRVESLQRHLPPSSNAREDFERSLKLAEDALDEGQKKLHGLRSKPGINLVDEVRDALFAEYPGIPLSCKSSGRVVELEPNVFEQSRAIAVEALRNAAKHASASAIRFEVHYAKRDFSMRITDDGRGLPQDVIDTGRGGGRWGLVGMRERAHRIGGEIFVQSKYGQGTSITVSMPARTAYIAGV